MKKERRQKVEETGVVHKYCLILFTTFAMQIIYTLHDGSDGKASVCNAGDLGLIPGSGRSPGKGNGYPLHYSCLENLVDRGTWWATVRGITKSWTRLSDLTLLTFHRSLSFWLLCYKWVDIFKNFILNGFCDYNLSHEIGYTCPCLCKFL